MAVSNQHVSSREILLWFVFASFIPSICFCRNDLDRNAKIKLFLVTFFSLSWENWRTNMWKSKIKKQQDFHWRRTLRRVHNPHTALYWSNFNLQSGWGQTHSFLPRSSLCIHRFGLYFSHQRLFSRCALDYQILSVKNKKENIFFNYFAAFVDIQRSLWPTVMWKS